MKPRSDELIERDNGIITSGGGEGGKIEGWNG